MDLALIEKFIISIALGTLLGTEREISHKERGEQMAGMRTFALIALMGTLLAHLSQEYPYLIVAGAAAFIALIISGYLKIGTEDVGITTEVGCIIAFLVGVLCYTETSLAVMLTIFTGLILAIRKGAHQLAERISEEELMDTFKFALIAFVVLPLLPNRTIDPLEVLNPYRIWLIVVFISGIGFVGYLLIRMFGAKSGTGITGILGGVASSTAVTITMSNRSKEISSILFPALFAATVANSIMFLRILVEILVIRKILIFQLLVPMVSMMVTGLAAALYFWKKGVSARVDVDIKVPFTLMPALKFGLFFAFVLIASKAALLYLGEAGVYITSVVSGLADVDAITLSMATLAGTAVSQEVAVDAIILAAISNVIAKTGMAFFFGSKEFRKYMMITSAVIMAVGLVMVLL